MMTSIYDYIEAPCTIEDWFSDTIRYSGHGVIALRDPRLVVEGDTVVTCSRSGQLAMQMEVGDFTEGDAHSFLELIGNPYELDVIIVTTDDGVFTSNKGWVTRTSTGNSEKAPTIELHIGYGEFQPTTVSQAQHWVLPLINFVTETKTGYRALETHPMRLRRKDIPFPADIPTDKWLRYRGCQNPLIPFEYADSTAYIEPVPDYEERRRKLHDEDAVELITAVMVGDMPPDIDDLAAYQKTLPRTMKHCLSFATGTPVGIAWTEFRDANRQLVRRIHNPWPSEPYRTGYAPFWLEDYSCVTSKFLTDAAASPLLSKPWMWVVLRHLVDAARTRGFLEDRFLPLFLAIECMARHGVLSLESKNQLLDHLTSAQQAFVGTVLAKAADEIEQYAMTVQANQEATEDEVTTLNDISRFAQRAPKSKNDKFRIAMRKFTSEFPDSAILDQPIRTRAQPLCRNIKQLSDLFTAYRNHIVHEGHLDEKSPFCQIVQPIRVLHHLHDLLVRKVFRLLDYTGEYEPRVAKWRGEKSVDWVQDTTPPNEFGYPI